MPPVACVPGRWGERSTTAPWSARRGSRGEVLPRLPGARATIGHTAFRFTVNVLPGSTLIPSVVRRRPLWALGFSVEPSRTSWGVWWGGLDITIYRAAGGPSAAY